MRRMDSEMVIELPDTPERLLFTRSVGQSSSRACGIEGKPSSSNQYSETTARNYSYQMNDCDPYDFSGNNVSVNGDKSSYSKINQFVSGTHDIRTIHTPDSSPELVLSGILNDNGTHPEMIDLSQENPFPTSYPTRNRVPKHKEEKHVSRNNNVTDISGYGKLGDHDFNRKNATSVDADLLFSQAKVARFISSSDDTEATHSHKNVPELWRSSVLNSGTNLEVVDLSQGSPSPLPYPIRHRGLRYKEEKYLRSQSERNEISDYGKLGVRALNSIDGLEKEKNNVSNSSKVFGSSNNITKAENIRCRSSIPRQKDKVIVQQLNSRTRNELIQSRHPELSFPQSIMQQNKPLNSFIFDCDLIDTKNSQAISDCKELKNPSNQRAPSSRVRNQGTEIGNGSDKVSQSTTVETNHNHLDVLHPKKNGHRMLVRNGCISPSNIASNKNNRNTKGIEDGGSIASEMPNTNSSQSTQLDVVLHPKSSRILLNNGCISPSVITRNNNDAKARGFEGGVIVPNDNSSSFKGRMTDTGKGKEVMNEELLGNSQHNGIIPSSRRSCLSPGQELTIISKLEHGTSRTNGCGAVHKHAESSSLFPSSFTTGKCMGESMSNFSSSIVEMSNGGTRHSLSIADKPEVATFQSGENITQVHRCLKLALEAPQHTGKRKKNFAHSNSGECSSSAVSSRISYDRRSAKSSDSRSIRSRKSVRVDTVIAPVVEINEVDSTTKEENHELSNESIAKSIQLESDEVLARQLQEQFYLELPPVTTEREALLPSLLGRRRSHQPSTRMTSRILEANEIDRIMRNISNSSMSLEERLVFLEALEADFEDVSDMNIFDHFLGGQHDFNETDYEMLLALDDNNHHVGASERQINNLPQSLIQNTDSGEACVVCLETPSVGDTIRHLPCLHKFHKNCIDTWLKRKSSCPICKHGIT